MHGRSDGLTDDLGVEAVRVRAWEHMNVDIPSSDLVLCLLELRPVSLTVPMHGAGQWSCVKHTCSGADLQELHLRDLKGCERVSQSVVRDRRILTELKTDSFACDTRGTWPLLIRLEPKRRRAPDEMLSTPST
jgi:hypothetical protein